MTVQRCLHESLIQSCASAFWTRWATWLNAQWTWPLSRWRKRWSGRLRSLSLVQYWIELSQHWSRYVVILVSISCLGCSRHYLHGVNRSLQMSLTHSGLCLSACWSHWCTLPECLDWSRCHLAGWLVDLRYHVLDVGLDPSVGRGRTSPL